MTLAQLAVLPLMLSALALFPAGAVAGGYTFPTDGGAEVLTVVSTGPMTGYTFRLRLFGDGVVAIDLRDKAGETLERVEDWLPPAARADLATAIAEGDLLSFDDEDLMRRMNASGEKPLLNDVPFVAVTFALEARDERTGQYRIQRGAAGAVAPEFYARVFPGIPELQALGRLASFRETLWQRLTREREAK